jgi:hypothetical protein
MPQQITDPDALAILQSTQAAPAPAASSGITDPDAMEVLQSAQDTPHWTPAQQATANQEAANGQALFAPSLADRVLSNIKDAGTAEWHHLGSLATGIAQTAAHVGNYIGNGGSQGAMNRQLAGVPNDPSLGDRMVGALDNFAARREAQYQKTQPNSLGTYVGAAMGEVAPWLIGMGEARALGALPEASSALGKIGLGAAEGSLIGSTNPVTDPNGSFAQQKGLQMGTGALAGGALPAVGQAARGLYGAVKPLVNPNSVATDFLGNVLGGKAPLVAQNLRSAPTYVPGSVPTSAQVGGVPELVQVEKSLANQSPDFKTALMERKQANDQARVSAVQNVAGTPDTLQAAKDARRSAIDPFVSQYLTDSRPAVRWQGAQDAFQSILDKPGRMPSADFDALTQANKITQQVRSGAMQEDDALEAMKELGDSVTTKTAQSAFQSATDAINRNMVDPSGVLRTLTTLRYGPLGVNPERATRLDSLIASVKGSQNINGLVGTDLLDAIRQETGKLARGATGQNGMAYGNANDSLVQAIDRVAPGYANYLGTYARTSQDITDQTAATGILDRLNGVALGADQRPILTLSRYASALKQANKGPFPLSAQAQDALGNVQKDLQRETVSSAVRTPGPDTAYNISAPGWMASKVYGPTFNGGGTLSKLAGKLPLGIGPFLTSFRDIGARNVFNATQKLMLDPQTLAGELDKLAAKNPQMAKLLGRLTQQQAAYAAPQLAHQP